MRVLTISSHVENSGSFLLLKTSISVLTVSTVTVAHASSEPRGSAPNFRGRGDLTSGSLLVAFKLALLLVVAWLLLALWRLGCQYAAGAPGQGPRRRDSAPGSLEGCGPFGARSWRGGDLGPGGCQCPLGESSGPEPAPRPGAGMMVPLAAARVCFWAG